MWGERGEAQHVPAARTSGRLCGAPPHHPASRSLNRGSARKWGVDMRRKHGEKCHGTAGRGRQAGAPSSTDFGMPLCRASSSSSVTLCAEGPRRVWRIVKRDDIWSDKWGEVWGEVWGCGGLQHRLRGARPCAEHPASRSGHKGSGVLESVRGKCGSTLSKEWIGNGCSQIRCNCRVGGQEAVRSKYGTRGAEERRTVWGKCVGRGLCGRDGFENG